MTRFIATRLAIMPLLLWGVVTVAFLLSHAVARNPLASIVGERNLNNPAIVEAATQRWGLDQSLGTQYLIYLNNLVLHADLGTSIRTKSPVATDLADRLPATLELALLALVFATVIGVLLGVVAAQLRGGFIDGMLRVVALLGSSLPVFWLGLIALFIFYVQLDIAPGPGRLSARVDPPPHVTGFYTVDALLSGNMPLFSDALAHLVMPALIMSLALLGTVLRLTRTHVIDETSSDYVRTARAKGLSRSQAMYRHALKNAITPVITIVGLSIGMLIMGAVLIETIFNWGGIGTYAVESARSLDFPAITGVCLVGGVIFLLSNLATDVTYAVIDPRVRLS